MATTNTDLVEVLATGAGKRSLVLRRKQGITFTHDESFRDGHIWHCKCDTGNEGRVGTGNQPIKHDVGPV